ncbi:hypothetical protein WA577_002999, partial [Blastocystis sp. JDR]
MNSTLDGSRRVPRSNYTNVVRESDVRADPDYKRKQEFFEALRLKVIMNCNHLKENALREANAVREQTSMSILTLSERIQNMTVADFCREFHFQLVDGNLVYDNNGQGGLAGNSPATVVRSHHPEFPTPNSIPRNDEVVTELQVVRHGGMNETSLRLIRNNRTFDLTPQRFAEMGRSEREMVEAEVVALMQMLRGYGP